MDQLTEKLALLRRGIQEFSVLQQRVAELDALTRNMNAYNQHMAHELADAQKLVEQWRSFFALSLDMLCIANTEGYFLDVNPAFVRTLGYDRSELLAQPFLAFVHPDDRASTIMEVEKLKHGLDTISFDNRYRCKDGRWLWLNWTTPAPAAGSNLLYAIARDITERKRSEEEVLFRAQHDSLTGLYNRAALLHEIGVALERMRRSIGYQAGLLFIDLNKFKPINDQHGHATGDRILAELGHRLHVNGRSTDFVARLGGDEFAVLVQGQEAIDVSALVRRYEQCFFQPFESGGVSLRLDAAIGYASVSNSDTTAEELLAQADLQMYQSKRGQRRSS